MLSAGYTDCIYMIALKPCSFTVSLCAICSSSVSDLIEDLYITIGHNTTIDL